MHPIERWNVSNFYEIGVQRTNNAIEVGIMFFLISLEHLGMFSFINSKIKK